MKTIKLIADDWGLSPTIDGAIRGAWEAGGLDGACVMMGQDFTAQAIAYARQNPELELGLHLFANDTNGVRPLTLKDREWPSGWPDGGPALWSALLRSPKFRENVFAEIEAQMQAFHAVVGRAPAFLNSHLHFHALPGVFPKIAELLGRIFPDFAGWIRLGRVEMFNTARLGLLGRLLGIPASTLSLVHAGAASWKGRRNATLWGMDRGFKMDAEEIVRVARTLGPGMHEFFFHPGRSRNLVEGKGKDAETLKDLGDKLPRAQREGQIL